MIDLTGCIDEHFAVFEMAIGIGNIDKIWLMKL